MKSNKIYKIALAAMFLALAYVLPFLTGQIPKIGSMLCPMHIPVIICGFVCGGPLGMTVGFIAPFLRSLTLGMPVLFPNAVCMAVELAVYGLVSGLMHKVLPKKKAYIYCSLLISMIAGRIVWGIAMLICMGIKGGSFTFAAFVTRAITNAIPGIILQIVLIPIVVVLLQNTKILKPKD